MNALKNIPGFLREQILKDLTITKICETLRYAECLESEIKTGPYSGIKVFEPRKTIFRMAYMDPSINLANMGPNEEIKPKFIDLDYFDCLDIIELQWQRS